MTTPQPTQSERQSRDVVRDRVRAWWAAVLVGQTTEAHPTHGEAVRAHMDGDTLVITGTAATAQERTAIEREAEHLKGQGMARIRNDLTVASATPDRQGLLVQTLVAFFASPDQAGFAAGYLEGHALIRARLLTLVDRDRDDADAGLEHLHAILPQLYWPDAESALNAGQTLLILVVDEIDAFKARELLEEETQSQRLLVLPPEPAGAPAQMEQAMRRAASRTDGESTKKPAGKPSRATHARQHAREREATPHDD